MHGKVNYLTWENNIAHYSPGNPGAFPKQMRRASSVGLCSRLLKVEIIRLEINRELAILITNGPSIKTNDETVVCCLRYRL